MEIQRVRQDVAVQRQHVVVADQCLPGAFQRGLARSTSTLDTAPGVVLVLRKLQLLLGEFDRVVVQSHDLLLFQDLVISLRHSEQHVAHRELVLQPRDTPGEFRQPVSREKREIDQGLLQCHACVLRSDSGKGRRNVEGGAGFCLGMSVAVAAGDTRR